MDERIQRLQRVATKAGVAIKNVEVASIDGTSGLGAAWVAVAGGTLRPDTVCVVSGTDPNGNEVTLFQPYLKGIQLPGEFHALVDGAVERPLQVRGATYIQRERRLRIVLTAICVASVVLIPVAIYLMFFHGRAAFVGGDGKKVVIGAETNAALAKLRRSASFGRARVYPKWLVQLSPAGDGKSRLVMHAADYGGLVHIDPGFLAFSGLSGALSANLPKGDNVERAPLAPARYADTMKA